MTIVARKGVPIQIKWTNYLPATHLLDYAIDLTIPKAHTTTGIPITTHVHGAEVEPESDGGPMTWFTPGFAETGHDWQKQVLTYANTQLPATIWYHDHAFGYTRHNVYAGLAGFYVVTDPDNEPAGLPSGPYDIGLALQDRMFTQDGQLWYPNVGVTAEHPIWIPEFFGDVITVNGKAWPYLEVDEAEERAAFSQGVQIIQDYYKKNEPAKINIVDLETRFEIEIGNAKETHIVAGFIDRIDKTDDGYEIIDYKTTKKMPSQEKVDNDIQLSIYLHAFLSRYPKEMENLDKIKVSLYYLKHGVKLSSTRTLDQLKKSEQLFLDTIKIIESGKFEPVISGLCDWCGYQNRCPMWLSPPKGRGTAAENR